MSGQQSSDLDITIASSVATQRNSGSGAPVPSENVMTRRVSARIGVVWKKAPREMHIALAGYLIVLAFMVAYLVATHASGWFGITQTSQPLAIAFAVLIALPLVIAFVWDRLTKVTIGTFSFELGAATAHLGDILPSKLQGTDITTLNESYLMSIAPGIQTAIKQEEYAEMLKVDLGNGDSWWSTRLYLLAALAEDYTRIRRIVFVERRGSKGDCFVGLATPAAIRRALARQKPSLEGQYRAAYSQAFTTAVGDVAPSAEAQVLSVVQTYGLSFALVPLGETGMKIEVTSERLKQWMGTELAAPMVPWDGGPATPLFLFIILDRAEPYVALVQDGQLRQMCNAQKLATTVADSLLRQRLA